MKKIFLTLIVTLAFTGIALADGGDTTKTKKGAKLKGLAGKTVTTTKTGIKPLPTTTNDNNGGGGVPNTKLTVNEEGVPANDKKQKSGTTTTTPKKEEGPK